MKRRQSAIVAISLAFVLVVVMVWFLAERYKVSYRVPFKNQVELAAFASRNKLPNMVSISEHSKPLCSSGDSGYDSGCTLSSSYKYKLDGDYRTEGKAIFEYLKSKGFDFKPTSKYIKKTDDALNDKSVAANMKGIDPIIVDLYHDKRDARVRVFLGNHERLFSKSIDPAIQALKSDQLIASLNFYSP